MNGRPKGTLVIVGGHEDKQDGREILSEVAKKASGASGKLTVVTVATQSPEEVARKYVATFKELGVRKIDVLDIRSRDQAQDEAAVDKIRDASVIFFTGGDQLRITSQVGDSPVYRCMQERYVHGATIAGTSAGAAVMPETMLISGPSDTSNEISALGMAPGLALISGVVIDSHFAERGRFGRLIGAIAQNPRNLGLGIDEDTAVIVRGEAFRVIGSGAVYVLDGSHMTYSSLSERSPEGILSVFDTRMHVLGRGDCFDLATRRPQVPKELQEESKS